MGISPPYENKDNKPDPTTVPCVEPAPHGPPPLPKHEENEYLHLITYELQRIANVNEFFALVEIEQREKSGFYGPAKVTEITRIRLSDLSEKIKEARV